MFSVPYMVIKRRCVWNKTFLLVPLYRIKSFHAPFHLFSQRFYIHVISTKASNEPGWEALPHAHLREKSTSAKPVMTKLQTLFVALVNMDIIQMTLKLSLFTVDF